LRERLGVLVLVLLVGAVPSALAQTTDTTLVAEAPDYASTVLTDAWDYTQSTDFPADLRDLTIGVDTVQHDDDGTAYWETRGVDTPDGWYVTLMWMAYPQGGDDPGALPDDRDGVTNPLDADRFTQLSMRIWTQKDTTARLEWFGCREYTDACRGSMVLNLKQGWNTIIRPIVNDGPSVLPRPWSGDILGLRLSGPDDVKLPFHLDWLRIHAPGEVVTVPSDVGLLRYDTDMDPNNNFVGPDYASVPAYGELPPGEDVETGAFPPGTYNIFEDGRYLRTVRVDPLPQPRILDPDRAGGQDYASVILDDPWDFSGPDDVVSVRNAYNVTYDGRVVAGTNANNDPYLVLPLAPSGLDPVHFHRLTVTTRYDGPFNLDDSPEGGLGGTHGRMIWRTPLHPSSGCRAFSDGRELVFFTDRQTYTYDLADTSDDPIFHTTAEPNQDPSSCPDMKPDLTWTAGPVSYLRFDPNEAPSAYRWYVDDLRLAADDAADPTFDITWKDLAAVPRTQATVRLDDDRSGFDGEVLWSGAPGPGTASLTFDATDRLPVSYWVNVTLQTPDGRTGRTYASGPLQVSPRIAGSDRVATAITLSEQTFRSGAPTAVVASSTTFPDALAAGQLATALGGPLLLTPPSALDGRVGKELDRLGVQRVVIAGGRAALSDAVELALRDRVPDVERLGGADRYATAGLLAEAALARWGQTRPDRLVLATGTAFPDALAAGPWVGHAHLPLLLSHPEYVSESTAEAIARLDPKEIVVVGGPAALSDDVVTSLAAGRPWSRIAGTDRFATASKLADAAVAAGASSTDVLIVTGQNFPDALAAGPIAVARGGLLLLTGQDRVPGDTAAWLKSGRDRWTSWRVVGGPATVPFATVRSLQAAAGLPVTP
jgi:putative cell wall-binding protein